MTNKTKYTQGQWIHPQRTSQVFVKTKSGTRLICNIGDSLVDIPEQLANAQLIAAAPELLEALKYMFKHYVDDEIYQQYASDIEALIKKAEGQA